LLVAAAWLKDKVEICVKTKIMRHRIGIDNEIRLSPRGLHDIPKVFLATDTSTYALCFSKSFLSDFASQPVLFEIVIAQRKWKILHR
jgi:hypothetical protein